MNKKNYNQLYQKERDQIFLLKGKNLTDVEIAKQLRVLPKITSTDFV